MFQRLRQRLGARLAARDDEGFTLIELLVVLLIMGILLAIAIPTYLSVTSSANTTAAQANLQTVLTAAKAYYVSSDQTYSALTSTSLTGTSLSLVDGVQASGGPTTVSIDGSPNNGQDAFIAAQSTDGLCYVVVDVEAPDTAAVGNLPATPSGGTFYGSFKTATCDASAAEGNSGPTNYSPSESSGW